MENKQATMELEQQIKSLQETYGIDDEAFDSAYDELLETDLKDKLNPELIVNYVRHKNAFTKAESVLSEVQPSLTSNKYVMDAVENIIFENPKLTDGEITEIVQSIYGQEKKKASKAVSKKIQSNSKEQSKGTPVEYENAVDFDDL